MWLKAVLLAWVAAGSPLVAATEPVPVAATEGRPLLDWSDRVETMIARGDLSLRWERTDPLVSGRVHQRYRQLHQGVPVYGGELVRQLEGPRTVSVFGTLYENIAVEPRPALSPDQAVAIVERLSGADLGPARQPELVVLPHDGAHHLCYRSRVATQTDVRLYFVDARTGALVHERSDLQTQSAVGTGRGVLNDLKKMSTRPDSAAFVSEDELRPPPLRTYDMKGDLLRVIRFLNGEINLAFPNDLARDDDNNWTDGAVVDAHTYAGWTYDYYFKRFGRRGLDNNDIRIVSLVHPVRRQDLSRYSDEIIFTFFLNAFYFGDGIMVYGEGLPPGFTFAGLSWNFFAGALDIVAHELTHGVTDYSSGLIYQGESGALNEAFSDIMAAGAEFFFQSPGAGPMRADYLVGEDVLVPGGLRSMSNPRAFGDPDHYSRRYTGRADNGGVHTNSGIANHAFYLAIEGGTNRTSGLAVQGVGGANRDQIEKVFYRAFVFMLPPSATFSTARATTIQAARDLFSPGSAAERAVTEAWTAVGVR